MSDEILLRLSRVKFTLHRFMMKMLEVPSDAMTSDQPFRERFATRLSKDCPGLPYLDDAALDIRRGVFGTLPMMEMAHAEGLLSDDEMRDLRNAYYFCNGNRDLDGETVFADGTRFRFSVGELEKWETLLGLKKICSA